MKNLQVAGYARSIRAWVKNCIRTLRGTCEGGDYGRTAVPSTSGCTIWVSWLGDWRKKGVRVPTDGEYM